MYTAPIVTVGILCVGVLVSRRVSPAVAVPLGTGVLIAAVFFGMMPILAAALGAEITVAAVLLGSSIHIFWQDISPGRRYAAPLMLLGFAFAVQSGAMYAPHRHVSVAVLIALTAVSWGCQIQRLAPRHLLEILIPCISLIWVPPASGALMMLAVADGAMLMQQCQSLNQNQQLAALPTGLCLGMLLCVL